MKDDLSLEEFVKMLDFALTSDNPAMKKTLKNMVMLYSLIDSENSHSKNEGPMEGVLRRVEYLENKLEKLEYAYTNKMSTNDYTYYRYHSTSPSPYASSSVAPSASYIKTKTG